MQIAGPGNRANPLRIVSPTRLRPFETTIRNRPATQAAAQAIEPAGFYSYLRDAAQFHGVGNIKPRVGMSILLASIQITIPRTHRRRLSSILKTPSRRRRSPGYFSYQTNGLPTWHMGSGPTSSPPSRKQRGRNARQRNQNRQKMPQWGLPAEKSFRIVRKRRRGASF